MAITQVGSTVTSTAMTTSWTQSSGTDLILVVVVTNEDGTILGVDFDGTALTQLQYADGGDRDSSMWYLINPGVKTGDIVVTDGGPGDQLTSLGVTITSWENVDQTTPWRDSNATTGTGSPITNTVTSAIGDLVIDGFIDNNVGTNTVGTGQTEISNFTHGGDNQHGSSYEAGASPTVVMTWTGTITIWASVAGSLKSSDAVAETKCCMIV